MTDEIDDGPLLIGDHLAAALAAARQALTDAKKRDQEEDEPSDGVVVPIRRDLL